MKIVAKREEIHRDEYAFNRTEYTDGTYMWNDFKGFTTYWNGNKHIKWSDILELEYQKIISKQEANSNGEHPEVDNPVPSLDNLLKEFMENEEHYHNGAEEYNEFLKERLQNGRETDKEQPKNGIWYKGKHLELSYVELYDLLHVYVLNSVGSLHRKCMNAFNTIIPTQKG